MGKVSLTIDLDTEGVADANLSSLGISMARGERGRYSLREPRCNYERELTELRDDAQQRQPIHYWLSFRVAGDCSALQQCH